MQKLDRLIQLNQALDNVVEFAQFPFAAPGSTLERLQNISRLGRNPFIRNAAGVPEYMKTAAQKIKPWERGQFKGAIKPLEGGYQVTGTAPRLFSDRSGAIYFADDNDTLGNAARWGGGAALGIGGLKLYQGIRKKQATIPGVSGPQMELPGMEVKPTFGQAARAYAKDIPGMVEGRAKQGWSAVTSLFSKLRSAV